MLNPLGDAAACRGDCSIHLRCRTGVFVILEDSLPGCLGRQASCLSVPWQAASEEKTGRLKACRPGQARHGTSPSDWRTGCLTSDAPLPRAFLLCCGGTRVACERP